MNPDPNTFRPSRPHLALLAIRSAIGGLMMGLANLVPGISGGTMLLASGVYPRFIEAIAEITTLKFRKTSLVVLGVVVLSAGAAILLLAGAVKDLVVDHRWVMYSLFIGLTLGGVPVVWKMVRTTTRSLWAGAAAGFIGMAALAWFQTLQIGASAEGAAGVFMLFFAGLAGASAMILPGVSGGYLLLVLGQYVPILSGIDQFKDALQAAAFADALHVAVRVLTPVGVGVVLGIVAVSNLLKLLLHRFENAILGVLLGLLLGAVVGLWPFQQGVEPSIGDIVKGRQITAEQLTELEPEDYPVEFFRPTAKQAGMALGLIVLGVLTTSAVARLGGDEDLTTS